MKMYFVRYNDYKICENGAVYLLFVSNMNITGENVYETHRDYFVEGLDGFVSMLHLRSTNVEN